MTQEVFWSTRHKLWISKCAQDKRHRKSRSRSWDLDWDCERKELQGAGIGKLVFHASSANTMEHLWNGEWLRNWDWDCDWEWECRWEWVGRWRGIDWHLHMIIYSRLSPFGLLAD